MKNDPILSKDEVMQREILHDLFYFFYRNKLEICTGSSGLTEPCIEFTTIGHGHEWICEIHGDKLQLFIDGRICHVQGHRGIPLADPKYREKVLNFIKKHRA